MLPGFSAELMPKGHEKESSAKIKRYMTMMDSMTNEGRSSQFCRGNVLLHLFCTSCLEFLRGWP